jgi:hypothetical protein
MDKMAQDVGSQKCKGQMNMWTETNRGALRSKIGCETNSRRNEYENLLGGKDPNSGLTSGFSTIIMPLCMMR